MFINQIKLTFSMWLSPPLPAGVDVREDERLRPPAEVEVIGRGNGVADAAGLLKPKLKPLRLADVVAGVPVLKKNSINSIQPGSL